MNPDTLLSALATLAAAWEAHAAPKPGLVDRLGSGAHKDMDYVTFLASACALSPFWEFQARVGLEGTDPERAMPCLRSTGLEMEQAMAAATGGVNTHKGLVYALSLLLYGAGFCLHTAGRVLPREAARFASEAVAPSVRDEFSSLKNPAGRKAKTHGERLYLHRGVVGIRGEAASGFPCVLDLGLPSLEKALKRGSSLNDAALHALFSIASRCEDSNVITRGGYEFWMERHLPLMADLARELPPYSGPFLRRLGEADAEYSRLGVSPGGAADLLTCSLFLYWAQLVNIRDMS